MVGVRLVFRELRRFEMPDLPGQIDEFFQDVQLVAAQLLDFDAHALRVANALARVRVHRLEHVFFCFPFQIENRHPARFEVDVVANAKSLMVKAGLFEHRDQIVALFSLEHFPV